MVTGKEILAIASREIGYHESKGKLNKYGEWFARELEHRTEGKESGKAYITAPYCMMFVQEMYHIAGLDLPCFTASCGELLRWYRKNQPECISDSPIPGCIVIFDFPNTEYKTDHTGLFVSKTDLKITTIDGNTSNGNDSNGGWVQQRTRSLSYANPTYIIPRELEDEDMDVSKLSNEDCYAILLKANEYAASLATPEWMESELKAAIEAGITDGTRPLAMVQRGAAAIMALRAHG